MANCFYTFFLTCKRTIKKGRENEGGDEKEGREISFYGYVTAILLISASVLCFLICWFLVFPLIFGFALMSSSRGRL